MTFPNGVADFWAPPAWARATTGRSRRSELLAPLKSQVLKEPRGKLQPWNGHIERFHASLSGPLTCARANGPMNINGGVGDRSSPFFGYVAAAVAAGGLDDHIVVRRTTRAALTKHLVGCAELPLFKLVNPQKVFDKTFGVMGPTPPPDVRALNKSILDQVLSQASSLQPALSRSDGARLDEFLTSVREVEANIVAQALPAACWQPTTPTETYEVGNVPADYNRNTHADIMIDLVALASSATARASSRS
jgi:hypothetical protein